MSAAVAPVTGRRKGAAASRKWMVVPAVGEERRVEFGKHQIMKMTGLPGRDLRVLDPVLSYPSTILGRDRAIVVRLQGVKAIITATEVLVPDHDDVLLASFLLDLRSRLSLPVGTPYTISFSLLFSHHHHIQVHSVALVVLADCICKLI